MAKLVEVLAMRPLIVELDISGNTVSDKVMNASSDQIVSHPYGGVFPCVGFETD